MTPESTNQAAVITEAEAIQTLTAPAVTNETPTPAPVNFTPDPSTPAIPAPPAEPPVHMFRDCTTCGLSSKVGDSYLCAYLSQADAAQCRAHNFTLYQPQAATDTVENNPAPEVSAPAKNGPEDVTDADIKELDTSPLHIDPTPVVFPGEVAHENKESIVTKILKKVHLIPDEQEKVIPMPDTVDPTYKPEPEAVKDDISPYAVDLREMAALPFMNDCGGYVLSTFFESGIRLEINTPIITGGLFIEESAMNEIFSLVSSAINGGGLSTK